MVRTGQGADSDTKDVATTGTIGDQDQGVHQGQSRSEESHPDGIGIQRHTRPSTGNPGADQDHECPDRLEGRGGGIERGTTPQEKGHQQRQLQHGEWANALEATTLDNRSEEPVQVASQSMSHFMEKESKNLGPRAFKQLMGRRAILVEVACSPESRLSSMIQKMTGHEDAAIRCSHWNGCDLGTQTGVDMILNTIDTCRPQHFWISPNCGPYSPLQSI